MHTITPTVGRRVWYFDGVGPGEEPKDAGIIKVWATPEQAEPRTAVNLDVVDPYSGLHFCRTSVQVGDENTPYPHFRWMPYQQDQAAKAQRENASAPIVAQSGMAPASVTV